MSRPLQRVAVVGATGGVGAELLALLGSRRFPLQELVPIASERSLGEVVELLDQEVAVQAEARLGGIDLVFLCTPRAVALDWMRKALRAEAPCFDLSAAAAASPEVPLLAADLAPSQEALAAPVIGCPSGPALAWALVLAPLSRAVGVCRVVGTQLEPASGVGRAGIEVLESETRALFNQVEPEAPEVFSREVAFDALPASGPIGPEGSTTLEDDLRTQLQRLVGPNLGVAATVLRVPTFAGAGASLAIETERALSPAECAEILAKAPGVRVHEAAEPSTRDQVGQECVGVGRVRTDPSRENSLLLWLAADPARLAASNAVRLAEARIPA